MGLLNEFVNRELRMRPLINPLPQREALSDYYQPLPPSFSGPEI